MVDLHLFGIELFQPRIFLYTVVEKTDSLLPFDLHRSFPFIAVVEPRLRPEPDPGPVGIDRNQPRDVETLYINLQFCQRVDEATARYGFVIKFFFTSSPIVERYTSCRRAR